MLYVVPIYFDERIVQLTYKFYLHGNLPNTTYWLHKPILYFWLCQVSNVLSLLILVILVFIDLLFRKTISCLGKSCKHDIRTYNKSHYLRQ